MEYEVVTGDDILLIIPLLMKAKIYQYKTWRMYTWYRRHLEGENIITKVSVCKMNKKIIGAAIHIDPPIDDLNVSVYVLADYRRNGIGTELVKRLNLDEIKPYDNGYRKEFWENVKR